jgi:hypothetical protein
LCACWWPNDHGTTTSTPWIPKLGLPADADADADAYAHAHAHANAWTYAWAYAWAYAYAWTYAYAYAYAWARTISSATPTRQLLPAQLQCSGLGEQW